MQGMTTMPSSLPATARFLERRGVAFAPQIAGAALKYRIDPALLAAVAAQETGGPGTNAGRNVVGDGGHGHGVFQIDDRFHSFARTSAAMDPQANAEYAARMLAGLLKRYGGDVHQALSAYNAGAPNAIGTRTDWQDGRELGYADSVLQHYALLTGSSAQSLTQSLAAENPYELAGVNLLASFAASQPPQAPHADRPWRDAMPSFASIVDSSATSE
jgi:hypothetical protein